ncbi:hypothetical protein CR513_45672, partial [Mucuna pruriens]
MDSIYVIMDRLIKYSYFFLINKLTSLYISQIVRLHGVCLVQYHMETLDLPLNFRSTILKQIVKLSKPSSLKRPLESFIGMTPYEALYDKRCRTPLCWFELGESFVVRPKVVQQTTNMVKIIQQTTNMCVFSNH